MANEALGQLGSYLYKLRQQGMTDGPLIVPIPHTTETSSNIENWLKFIWPAYGWDLWYNDVHRRWELTCGRRGVKFRECLQDIAQVHKAAARLEHVVGVTARLVGE